MVLKIHFTLYTRCVREVEVPDDFTIKRVSTQKVYQELCKKLPEEKLSEIEDDEVYDFKSQDFGQIDGIEIIDKTNGVIKEYFGNRVITIKSKRISA
jgi:hypothetical protein